MRSTRRTVALAVCCGASASLAQSIGTLRHQPTDKYMRSTRGRAAVLPQEELIAGLPYDGSSSVASRGQEFESIFDIYDIFLIEDIEPIQGARLGEFRSAGVGNGNPFGAEDVRVRIFENNGTGLPGEGGYTGSLVLTSVPGAGFFSGNTLEWVTNFGQQCLPAGSYYLVYAVRLDFNCCGGSFFFVQSGTPSRGGGEPNNAWFWNPGNGFGLGTHTQVVDTVSGERTGVNYLLFGDPANCDFPCSNPDCPADLDGDGDTDADDFFAYLDLFVNDDPCADIDQDGDADADDFFAYLDLFVQGC